MAKCSLCANTGYKHVIDLQGQHYDITESEEPIYHSIKDDDSAFALCGSCADKLEEKGGVSYVRDYLYMKETPLNIKDTVLDFNIRVTKAFELPGYLKDAILWAYNNERYITVCDLVDGVYGHKPGELERENISKKGADWALKQVGLDSYVK